MARSSAGVRIAALATACAALWVAAGPAQAGIGDDLADGAGDAVGDTVAKTVPNTVADPVQDTVASVGKVSGSADALLKDTVRSVQNVAEPVEPSPQGTSSGDGGEAAAPSPAPVELRGDKARVVSTAHSRARARPSAEPTAARASSRADVAHRTHVTVRGSRQASAPLALPVDHPCASGSLAVKDLRQCARADLRLPELGGLPMLLPLAGPVLIGLGLVLVACGRNRRLRRPSGLIRFDGIATMGESEQSPTVARQESRRGRPLPKAGCTLIVVGAAVLGHVGWEFYGTTWLAQREYGRTVQATERAWSAETAISPSKEDRELAKDVVALVRIPALGEEYVVPAYQGTDDETLERGFGILEDSRAPGAVGNFTLGGHRITHGEPLRRMPSLEAGDRIIVETADATYRYVLDTAGESRTVGSDSTWVTQPDPIDPETRRPVSDVVGSTRLVTLVTCAEIFRTDDRLVAFGHLVARDR